MMCHKAGYQTMRMRHKKHGAERIAACAELLILPPPDGTLLRAENIFPIVRPLSLEIGCGKGDFAVGMAAKHPDENWIAMERVPDVACLALEKAMAARGSRPDNLRFLIGNAQNLEALFPDRSFDCIYLNFSDPWPKSGYARRRLTHAVFLERYRRLLIPGGMLKFKTDNADLFAFSLEQFAACGLELLWQTDDLHASDRAADNVMTEYERNFTERGQPIFSAWVRFPEEKDPEGQPT